MSWRNSWVLVEGVKKGGVWEFSSPSPHTSGWNWFYSPRDGVTLRSQPLSGDTHWQPVIRPDYSMLVVP